MSRESLSFSDRQILIIGQTDFTKSLKSWLVSKSADVTFIAGIQDLTSNEKAFHDGIIVLPAHESNYESFYPSLRKILNVSGSIVWIINSPMNNEEKIKFDLLNEKCVSDNVRSYGIFTSIDRETEDAADVNVLQALILSLLDEISQASGNIFELRDGFLIKHELNAERNVLKSKKIVNKEMNPERLSLLLKDILRVDGLNEDEKKDTANEFLPVLAKGYVSEPFNFHYGKKEVILYALGVGLSLREESSLRFLYEGHPDFTPLPGFGVIPAMEGLESVINGKVPNLNISLKNVLHGEQYTEFMFPMPSFGTLTSTYEITDILDKGKAGSIVLIDITSSNDAGRIVLRNQFSIFVVGKGGFGGPRNSNKVVKIIPKPESSPDAVREFKTSVDQGALYRLSGDFNPLHIDPIFASEGGFEQPILHGLCTYGIALTMIMNEFANSDPKKIKAAKVRFAKPVIPGQTIRTEMWKYSDDPKIILFSCTVKESAIECISGGWAQLI